MKISKGFGECTKDEKIERLLKAVEWLTEKLSNTQYHLSKVINDDVGDIFPPEHQQHSEDESCIKDANFKYLYESIIGEKYII